MHSAAACVLAAMLGGGTPLLLLTYYYYIPHYHSSTCPGFTVLALGPGFRPIFIHSFIVAPGAKQHRSCMHCDAQAAAAICCCPVIHLREAGNIQRPVEKPGSTHCTDAQAWVGMRLDAYTPHPPSPPASLHATGWHPHAGLPGGKVGEGRRAIRGEKGQPCISNKGCGLLCTLLWSAWVRLGPPGSWAAWVRLGPGPPGSCAPLCPHGTHASSNKSPLPNHHTAQGPGSGWGSLGACCYCCYCACRSYTGTTAGDTVDLNEVLLLDDDEASNTYR